MRLADIGNHRHLRLCDIGKTADFSEVVHPHFQHGNIIAVIQLQYTFGQTDFIIEIFRCGIDTIF